MRAARELLKELEYEVLSGSVDINVNELVYNTAKVTKECLFVCIKGMAFDSHDAAAKAAKDLHQSYIGSEHILVGLLKEKTGVAARVLSDNGVDEVQLVSMIKELIAPEGNVALLERDGYSPRAAKVLEDSHRLAEKFKSQQTGTEHILLAILREGENVGLRLLNTIGVNVQKLYMDTLIAMGEDINQHKDDLNKSSNKKRSYGTLCADEYIAIRFKRQMEVPYFVVYSCW